MQFGPVRIVGKVFVVANSDDGFEGVPMFLSGVLESFGDRFRKIRLVLGGTKDEPVDGE